ncbi:MAG: CPBP family intramembrane glutamic endopeptidase [Anaerolineae bacterium]
MEQTKSPSKGSLLGYFILAFGFSWFFWLFGVLASQGVLSLPFPNLVVVVIGAHGPLVASLILTYREEGWAAVKNLLRSGFRLRMGLIWWLVSLVIPLVLTGLAMWINLSLSDFQPDLTLLSQPLLILPTYLFMFFLGGSVQEEFGWRGYALPRLLERWNPLIATLVLGLIWGVWHLPLFYISGVSQAFMPFGVFWALGVAFSIPITWVFLRTERNLFSALLFHTAINASLSVFPPIEQEVGGNQMALTYMLIGYVLVDLVIVLADRTLWFEERVS